MASDQSASTEITFAQWLGVMMRRAGVNGSQIARGTGVSQSNVTRFLQGGQIPGRDTIRALAEFFDVPVLEVLVAAGYLTRAESKLRHSDSLYLVDSRDLLDELRSRVSELERRADEQGLS